MSEHATQANSQNDAMVRAYRHDIHKLTGESHRFASDRFDGVPVNQPVPHGADADAASLSRPAGTPKQTVANHDTPYRLSLITGESIHAPDGVNRSVLSAAINKLVTTDDAVTLHRIWLTSEVASGFNESMYYPYTSLKYHTLLVAALLNAYRNGYDFDDLLLVVDEPNVIEPHQTIFANERFSLRLDTAAEGQPCARLGRRPWRSWASTWNRLTDYPLDTDHDRYDMLLDSNLRRIWSWSTALQYIEDFTQRRQMS